ncbi:uncharacterized protein CANTADRAFT_27528 [Suhomyces tanzawaensis NRRL Y-17324]|uniref:MMS19 nucleotide excision repair protein n=1 Tax=Suhomyces tanzawaensis NRRL Y-17324 TaxID=984487 RepID=A0A1E4SB69_9ASCO|nr:uncharacterized protein CANTADRAFT_27528 [Suhomyces tanzawaensis NRRL Y-17324]ODV76749.1 hypothetical protein CANTADRAFT_27528 [Suhomyces tanzawaensis NRRL Y-17324]
MSIHDVPTLINQFIASVGTADLETSQAHALQLSLLLASGELSLLQFIQNLGPSLTSDNDIIRSKSLNCLSATLEQLQKSKLSKQDINVLVDFLLNKFDDKICLQYVLITISLLVQFSNFLHENIDKVLLKVLQEYDPKKNLAKVRHEAFQILQQIYDHHNEYLVKSHNSSDLFVKTFIHLATGEKDPRNLLTSFGLNITINSTFTFDPEGNDLHNSFMNDLFDVCFCYFPISFTPPANDPYKITADDLKLKLRACIASQTLFAKDSFSSLIEKLTSTNPTIRNDVLKTLLQCVENYSTETLEEYWLTIWNALKFEILHNDVSMFKSDSDLLYPAYDSIDDTDDTKCLILTLVIVQKLAQRLGDVQMDNFLQTIKGELKENLVKAKDKSKQSVLLLSSVASLSIHSFNLIVSFLFSIEIWGKYISNEYRAPNPATELDVSDETLNVSMQRDLVDNFGFVFTAYLELIARISTSSNTQYLEHFTMGNELSHCKDHLLIFLGQLLMTSSNLEKTLKSKTIQQLVKLIKIHQFLNDNEVNLIFGYFGDIIDSIIKTPFWEKDLVLGEIVTGLTQVMDTHEQLVIDNILANLLIHLESAQGDFDQFERLLNLIGKICVNHQFLEILSIRLSNKLNPGIETKLFQSIVELFIDLIVKIQATNQFLMNSWYKSFVPRILTTLTKLEVNPDEYLIDRCGDLVGLIIRFIEKSKHQAILDDFLQCKIGGLPNVFEQPHQLVSLINKILANVDKSVKFEQVEQAEESVTKLIYSLQSDEFLRIQYLQTLSILVNKFDTSDQSSKLEKYYGKKDFVSFEILIWLIKALILRTDRVGIEYLGKLIDDLTTSQDIEVKHVISKSLTILFIDLKIFDNTKTTSSINAKKLISKVTNLNVKLLYKQQVFELILPRLIENCESSENHPEISLNALSLIIENISTKILSSHLKEILPLVLRGLAVKDSTTIIKSSLSTLKITIEESQSIIQPHLSTLIPSLLNWATKVIRTGNVRINSEEIRILSLRCLILIFTKFNGLERYKASALNELKGGLDDKKRAVRKLCCDLRQVLYEL